MADDQKKDAAKPAIDTNALIRSAAETFIPGGKLVSDLVDGKGVTASGLVQTFVPGPLGAIAGQAADGAVGKIDGQDLKAGAAKVGGAVQEGLSATGAAISNGTTSLRETFAAPAVAAAAPNAAAAPASTTPALDALARGENKGRFDTDTYKRAQAFLAQNNLK